MDYDKLINDLRWWAAYCGQPDHGCLTTRCILDDATTAIETLRDENTKLRTDWEKYQPREHWETLNEAVDNLHADLARVTAERNAAIEWIQQFTETIDRPCAACKHNNEQDLKTYCKGCGSMGAPSCKWEWRGVKKED